MEIFQTSELSKAITFVRRRLWVVFHEANGLQNQESLLFLTFRASWLSKVPILSKDIFDESLNLQVFQSSRAFKIPNSFKRCLWVSFSSYGRLTKITFAKLFYFEKRCILVVLPKREIHKISKMYLFASKNYKCLLCNMHA